MRYKTRTLLVLVTACLFSPFTYGQNIHKLRVLVAPGVAESKPQDWHNLLTVSGDKLTLHCPKCSPIQTVSVAKTEVASLRYGENAYHHWKWAVGVGLLIPFGALAGLAMGLTPHHKHFFSVDMRHLFHGLRVPDVFNWEPQRTSRMVRR